MAVMTHASTRLSAADYTTLPAAIQSEFDKHLRKADKAETGPAYRDAMVEACIAIGNGRTGLPGHRLLLLPQRRRRLRLRRHLRHLPGRSRRHRDERPELQPLPAPVPALRPRPPPAHRRLTHPDFPPGRG